jgi:cytochrome c-type biogenesis protein CcmH/NrfF
MLQFTKEQKEYSFNNLLQEAFPPVCSNNDIDKTFANDLKVILRATKYIDNPTTQQKILEFCLATLIAKYVESKISYLIETDLQKALNRVLA